MMASGLVYPNDSSQIPRELWTVQYYSMSNEHIASVYVWLKSKLDLHAFLHLNCPETDMSVC